MKHLDRLSQWSRTWFQALAKFIVGKYHYLFVDVALNKRKSCRSSQVTSDKNKKCEQLVVLTSPIYEPLIIVTSYWIIILTRFLSMDALLVYRCVTSFSWKNRNEPFMCCWRGLCWYTPLHKPGQTSTHVVYYLWHWFIMDRYIHLRGSKEWCQGITLLLPWFVLSACTCEVNTLRLRQNSRNFPHIYICVCVCVCMYVFPYSLNSPNIHLIKKNFLDSKRFIYIYIYIYMPHKIIFSKEFHKGGQLTDKWSN